MQEKNKRVMRKFYENKIRVHGFSPKGFDWGSKISQRKRFEVFLHIGDLNGKKVLDLGCGAGDFYKFLKEKKIDAHYVGCDIVRESIRYAKEKCPEADFRVGDIDQFRDSEFDYIFESGIFNVLIQDNEGHAKETIVKMFKSCRLGIGINMLSKYRFDKIIKSSQTGYRFDPGEMFNFCRNISQKVVLKHDYMPNDFTIFMYKDTNFD